jgi:hypothetical protein
MEWIRTEEEVDAMIEEMLKKGKGKYVTQGVAFNKSDPRQMGLLKKSLMSSTSFGGMVKEMLAIRFNANNHHKEDTHPKLSNKPQVKDTGNFI